jgi:hypothetical protein
VSAAHTLRRLASPLRSRKVRVALATVVTAFLTDYGFAVREELIYTILAVGAALILGIAHEDTARPPGEPARQPASPRCSARRDLDML